MTVEKCYRIYCDDCNGTQWDYSYKGLKKFALREFKESGWRVRKGKAICPDCLARETMICPDCKGKLIQKKDVIQCENKECEYYLANKEGQNE